MAFLISLKYPLHVLRQTQLTAVIAVQVESSDWFRSIGFSTGPLPGILPDVSTAATSTIECRVSHLFLPKGGPIKMSAVLCIPRDNISGIWVMDPPRKETS